MSDTSEEATWYEQAADSVTETWDETVESVEQTWDSTVESVEQTWDSTSDYVEQSSGTTAEPATGGWYDTAVDSFVHTARQVEDAMDTDDDGSLADEIGGNWIKDVPIVGESIGSVGEEIGDFATDYMGTRHQGFWTEDGTWSPDTTDKDYQGDGVHQGGMGQSINEEYGVGEQSPWAIVTGPRSGTPNPVQEFEDGVIDEFQQRVDPWAAEQTDYNNADYDGDPETGPQTQDWLYSETGDAPNQQ